MQSTRSAGERASERESATINDVEKRRKEHPRKTIYNTKDSSNIYSIFKATTISIFSDARSLTHEERFSLSKYKLL